MKQKRNEGTPAVLWGWHWQASPKIHIPHTLGPLAQGRTKVLVYQALPSWGWVRPYKSEGSPQTSCLWSDKGNSFLERPNQVLVQIMRPYPDYSPNSINETDFIEINGLLPSILHRWRPLPSSLSVRGREFKVCFPLASPHHGSQIHFFPSMFLLL